jgi:hypothetical protein
MRILLGCLLLGACTSPPERPPPDDAAVTADAPGAVVPTPGVDGGPVYNDPPPGTPAARLMALPVDFDFGTVNTGSAARQNPVTITNVGDAQSAPLQATLMSAADLKLTTNCQGRQLRPGETCVVTATFEAKSVGPQAASGSVTDGSGTSFGVVMFMARGTGRLGPDAGPDVAPPPRLDAGMEAGALPKDAGLPPDLGRDLAPDVAPDVGPKLDTMVPPDAGSPDQASSG